MRRTTLTVLSILVAVGAAAAGDTAAEVRAVFSAKCAACHGPALARPKGRFGYVLDLARVAGNPEMVVPGAPDESELWELVRRAEMPPDDSPTGPLTADEKATVRVWIAAGAPAVASGVTAPTVSADRPESAPPAVQVLRRLGRLHILVIHFPIALLIAAAAGELWYARRGSSTPEPAVRFCVALAAAGAVAAATLGWLHAWGGSLWLHRWLGTAAGAWAVVTALQSELEARRGRRSPWFRVSVVLGALLVGAAGHFGGILVHGDDFFP